MSLLYGLPVLLWLYRRIHIPVAVVALLGMASVLPGVMLSLVGLGTKNELLFIGIYLAAGGAWSAILGATLFDFLRRAPAIPITFAAMLFLASAAGASLTGVLHL